MDFIKQYPEVSELLEDDRVEIVFTDGRKYLKQHQDKNYDIILMNTTWNWRAYASNLLSADFLNIIEQSLAKEGVLYYNTTKSLDAYYTAQSVYDYVYKYKFFVLASNNPVIINQSMIKDNLCQLKNYKTKQPVFATQEQCAQAAEVIMSNPLLPYKDIDMTELGHVPCIITDNNMITEYKYGKGL